MSRAIERGKAIISEMIEGLQADIDEADLVRTVKDYLVDQQYVTEEVSASLPNSAEQICDSFASRFGWSIAFTADTLCDFGTQSGIDREAHLGRGTNWRCEGF